MFESLIGTIAIVALIVVVARLHSRLGLLEREIGALRSFVLANPPATGAAAVGETVAREAAPEIAAAETGTDAVKAAGETPEATATPALSETTEAGPWGAKAEPPAAEPAEPAKPHAAPKRPDIETALGTRWAVWVGGVALALGGVFLIRYSIEAGFFGPAFRLSMAALLGLVLVGVGEFIRRTGYRLPVEGAAGAYVPGILTAAGAFTLFGTVYAAHGLYGFIGPTLAFSLLGIIGLGTIGAALVHGQALAGVGLLGSMITPALVSSQSPSAWALFGYLAIVLVANVAVARLRDWKFLAAAGFAGIGLWNLVYLAGVGVARDRHSRFRQCGDACRARLHLARPANGSRSGGDRLAVDPSGRVRRHHGPGAAGRSGILPAWRDLRTGADGGARRRRALPAGGAAATSCGGRGDRHCPCAFCFWRHLRDGHRQRPVDHRRSADRALFVDLDLDRRRACRDPAGHRLLQRAQAGCRNAGPRRSVGGMGNAGPSRRRRLILDRVRKSRSGFRLCGGCPRAGDPVHSGERTDRARRSPAAEGRAGGFLRARRGGRRFGADVPHGVRRSVDDHPYRRGCGRSGAGDPCPRLSGARLALGRRGHRRAWPRGD